jgi:gephyrin
LEELANAASAREVDGGAGSASAPLFFFLARAIDRPRSIQTLAQHQSLSTVHHAHPLPSIDRPHSPKKNKPTGLASSHQVTPPDERSPPLLSSRNNPTKHQSAIMSQYKMISIPEAVATVLEHTPLLPAETVPLSAALGRVLASAVAAKEALPPFPASIKDGYAVRHADGAGERDVVGESRAGNIDEALECGPGQAVYVTTGAPVPRGADAVVQIEDTRAVGVEAAPDARRAPPVKAGGKVDILVAPGKVGQDIRAVGSDIQLRRLFLRFFFQGSGGGVFLPPQPHTHTHTHSQPEPKQQPPKNRPGAEVLAAGERVGVAEVGLLATVGAAHLSVRARPVVAVLSTGDEVVDPANPNPPGPGQIRDCNRAMLLAAAEAAGATAVDLGIARDEGGDLSACLSKARAAGADILVTSGGVSMGDRDLVKPLLEQAGTVHFGRVLMKPGKPLTFATLPAAGGGSGNDDNTTNKSTPMLVFGLPGNPVSSFVCFSLAVVPALRRMAGWQDPSLRRVRATLTLPLKLDHERPEYHRATLTFGLLPKQEGDTVPRYGWLAESTGNQISSRLLSARSANALLELPRAEGTLAAGAEVSALLLPGGLVEAFPQQQAGEGSVVPVTDGFC